MFSVRFTVLLLFILLVPFYLRFKSPLLEPYPAVLMPVGATKIRQQANQVAVKHTALYGLDKGGRWQQLDPQLFIDPIPLQYLPHILATDFGLHRDSSKPKKSGGAFFRVLNKPRLLRQQNVNANDTAAIKAWLRQKLKAQGLTPAVLKTITVAETVSLQTQTSLSKKTIRETLVRLDQ